MMLRDGRRLLDAIRVSPPGKRGAGFARREIIRPLLLPKSAAVERDNLGGLFARFGAAGETALAVVTPWTNSAMP